MWQKFDQSLPAAGFYPWACRIAHLKLLEAFARNVRDIPVLDREILEQVTADAMAEPEFLTDIKLMLQACMEKLPQGDRELIDCVMSPGCGRRHGGQAEPARQSVSEVIGTNSPVLWQCVDDALKSQANEQEGTNTATPRWMSELPPLLARLRWRIHADDRTRLNECCGKAIFRDVTTVSIWTARHA